MEATERIELIKLRLKKIRASVAEQQLELTQLQLKNKQLEVELEELKKGNFELKKQIKIANMANQLGNELHQSSALKQQLNKYIREVDSVIDALKHME